MLIYKYIYNMYVYITMYSMCVCVLLDYNRCTIAPANTCIQVSSSIPAPDSILSNLTTPFFPSYPSHPALLSVILTPHMPSLLSFLYDVTHTPWRNKKGPKYHHWPTSEDRLFHPLAINAKLRHHLASQWEGKMSSILPSHVLL